MKQAVTSEQVSQLLQSKLSGEKIQLTSREINTFYKEQPSRDSSRFRTVLYYSLMNKVLDPDVSLMSLIKYAEGQDAAYAIVMALRAGANPNLYVRDQEMMGNIHILAYLYWTWKMNMRSEVKHLNLIVLLLIHYGSSPVRQVFDDNGGAHIADGVVSKNDRTVIQWLDDNSYTHILDIAYPDFSTRISPDVKKILSILTADPKYLLESGGELLEEDVERIIKAKSGDAMLKDAPLPTIMNNLDMTVIYWAVENNDYDAVSYYTTMGIVMSYPLINTVILRIKQYRISRDKLFYNLFSKMLEVQVRNGAILDNHQKVLLGSASKSVSDRINNIYKLPYWEKVCANTNANTFPSPGRLRDMAMSLDIENSSDQAAVCSQLSKFSESDIDLLKSSAMNRQRLRFESKHGYISEFPSGKAVTAPALYCVNRSSLDGDYGDYHDRSVASYRDLNGDIWCFPASNYDYILETRSNPISGTPLTDQFIHEVQDKKKWLSSLAPSIRDMKYSQAIDAILQPDKIDNSNSEMQLSIMMEKVIQLGISPSQLKSLTSRQIDQLLLKSGYSSNSSLLTSDHALTTMAYIINEFELLQPSKYNLILDNLRDAVAEKEDMLNYRS